MPRYSESDARAAIPAATCWSQALRALGLRAAGGNFRVLKHWAAEWKIPAEHFAPYAHVGAHLRRPQIPLDEILIEGSGYKRHSLKRRLYEAGLKTRSCERCGQGEQWRGRPMTLILDHINGVHDDNRLENLQILCPNCAATLPTHCSRNLPPRICATCGGTFRRKSTRQQYCSQACWQRSDAARAIRESAQRRKVERPSHAQLIADLRELSWVAVGAKHGVSDNAERKWMRRYEREAAAQRSRFPAAAL